MITPCPHCQAKIEIDAPTLAALAGESHFACPACQAAVEVPAGVVSRTHLPRTSRKVASVPTAHARSGHRNLLILGTVALLVLGGIGIYLASQKSGDAHNTSQNIRNEIINNAYFQNLIASGKTTKAQLEAMKEIRPFGDGFVGASKDALGWEGGLELARNTSAEILPLPFDTGKRKELVSWIGESFPSSRGETYWVREGAEARVLDGAEPLAPAGLDRKRLILFHWPPGSMQEAEVGQAVGKVALGNLLQRKLAESVLSKNGGIEIWESGNRRLIGRLEDLPPGSTELAGIYLEPNNLDDEDGKLLADCGRLQRLRLVGGSSGLSSIPFASLPELQWLDLAGCPNLTTGAFKDLHRCSQLVSLWLSSMPLDGGITSHLAKCPSLQEIGLVYRKFQNRDLSSLVNHPKLRKIQFGPCDGALMQSGEGLDVLTRIPTLEHISIVSSDLPQDDLRFLRAMRNLTSFEIRGSRISDTALASIASVPSLSEASFDTVTIVSTGIPDDGIGLFAANPKLSRLAFVHTKNAMDGARELATMGNLSFFMCAGDTIVTEAAMMRLARAVPNIRTMHVRASLFSEKVIETLATCRGLEDLVLDEATGFGPSWVPPLARMPSLKVLTIQGPYTDDTSVAALGELRNLRTLRLPGSRLTPDGLARLKALLPECEIQI